MANTASKLSPAMLQMIESGRAMRFTVYQNAKGVHLVWDRVTNKARLPIKTASSEGAPTPALANFADAYSEVMTLNGGAK